MNDEPKKTVKDTQPAPISSTSPGAGEDLLRAGVMQAPDQPGMLGKIGRFDVIRQLGQGGMGQVLLALEPATHVKVAVKVLKPQLAQDTASVHRFLTEARHAYAMSHPNILKVLEVSDSHDRPFYVVPYIESGSLARRISPQKPLPTETALDIARQIASALSYAHGRGIIHRDLKPANVLMDHEGHAYLTDFGLLRTVFNDSFVDVQQSSLEGTAPYMSPAVVAGKAEDTRCDIYSFGAMLYEMLTGQPPFTGPSVDIILKKVTAGPPEPILKINPKASKELATIADWAMARELRDRYATMADVLADLERVAKGKAPVGPRGTVGLGRPMRKNLAIAGAVVVVVALVAFGLWRTATDKPPKITKSLSFDGELSFVKVGISQFPHVTNTFTIELWASPAASRSETAEANSGNQVPGVNRYAVFPDQGDTGYGVGHAGAGLSIGKNGISVFEHANNYLPSRLVYSAPITGWTHVALVYSNRSPTLYVNGVFAKGASASVKNFVHPSANLGGSLEQGPGYGNYQGQLAEVRIWNTARTATELQANMHRSLTGRETGLCGYWPLDEGNGILISDASGNGLAGRLMGGTAWVPSSRKVPSAQRGAVASGQKIDLTSGLVAHFPLDGHVRDVTGNGHDGQIRGNVKYVNGPIGQAADFDGSACFTLPDEKFLDGSSNATVAFWFFSRGSANDWSSPFITTDARDGFNPIIVILGPPKGSFRWCGFEDTITTNQIGTSWSPPARAFQNFRWHFFSMTLESRAESTTVRIYVDGELKQTTAMNETVLIRYDRPMPTCIGSDAYGGAPWLGSLDDVRIYNRTLSPAEIQKLFTAGGSAQNLSVGASPAVPPAAPAMIPPPPAAPGAAAPGSQVLRRPVRLPSPNPTAVPAPVPMPGAPPPVTVPARRPVESAEARLAKMQALFKGKVTLRPDGRFEFFYDFSDPAQLDDWIIREATAAWVVGDGWLVCKKNATQGASDTRLYHKALFAGKDREIHYDAQGRDNLAAGLFAEFEDWRRQYHFRLSGGVGSEHGGPPGGFMAGMSDLAVTNLGMLDPKHTYHADGTVNGNAFSFEIDGKATLRGLIPPSNLQTGQMAYLKLAYSPGRYDNVRIVGALDPAITWWQYFLKQADAAYDENRFEEAIKLYDAALAGMEQDQSTDAAILKTMKAAAVKHRGLASFIPQRDKLPADKQVEALHTKLRELNPSYNGKGRFTVRDGKIVEAVLRTLDLSDISPLKGLSLSTLDISETGVQDLSPLRGMPLLNLGCTFTPIADLSPLKGMRLIGADFHQHRGNITDLSPLQGMPLEWFSVWGSPVKDLSPLKGAPLKFICITDTLVEDLSPLEGMPLENIEMVGTLATDFSPLRKCPLKVLCARGGRGRDLTSLKGLALQGLEVPANVTDLSPLAGMQVEWLAINAPNVTDLTPLKGMPLHSLFIRAKNIKTGWEVIRQMPTLKFIIDDANTGGNQPVAEFWKRFDVGEFTNAVPK